MAPEKEEKPEEIRHRIEATSQDLKSKVEQLEQAVVGTVKGTTEAVGDTVEKVKDTVDTTIESVKETVTNTIESVKETVSETVATVRRTFDLRRQTELHPWPMMGLSTLAGFVTGKVTEGLFTSHRPAGFGFRAARSYVPPPSAAARATPPPMPAASPAAPAQPGLISRLLVQFSGEIQRVKEMAIGTIVGTLRDMAKRSLPETLAPKVDQVMDSITTKLGGEVMPSPVMRSTGRDGGRF